MENSGIDSQMTLLEQDLHRKSEGQRAVDALDPSRSISDVFYENMRSYDLLIASAIKQSIVFADPNNRVHVSILVLLVLLLAVGGVANRVLKFLLIEISVSSPLYAEAMARFLNDAVGIISLVALQYAFDIFAQQNAERNFNAVESIVIAVVVKIVLCTVSAIGTRKREEAAKTK